MQPTCNHDAFNLCLTLSSHAARPAWVYGACGFLPFNATVSNSMLFALFSAKQLHDLLGALSPSRCTGDMCTAVNLLWMTLNEA